MIRRVLIVVPPLVNRDGEVSTDPSRPDFEAYRLVSPIEPATVAADLLRRGFEVRLFDLGCHKAGRFERLAEAMRRFAPDAVAVVQSILTFATAQDWDGDRIFELARREAPGALTILSGGHATNYPGQAVAEGVCDYSIKGEVDLALGELLGRLRDGAETGDLPGLTRLTDAGPTSDERYPQVDCAALPRPAYHLLDADHQRAYESVLEFGKIRYPAMGTRYRDVMTSRSCVLRCSFCCVAHLRGETQRRRRKPLDLVVGEIEDALAAGIEEIHFFDDLFAESEAEVLEFCAALRQRGLRFPWFVAQGMPLWPCTHDSLAAMAETGMYRLICPFESGSDRVLQRVVGKVRSTVEHHHEVAVRARELDLEVIGMFVVGLPGEGRDEILATLRFAAEHPEIDYSVFSIATPMVGTKLMRQVTRTGRLADPGSINRVIKRTVALYETEAFRSYELGVIRAFDWDRINFPNNARAARYARMVGLTLDQLAAVRAFSKATFYKHFPDYDGPTSFFELYDQPDLFAELEPLVPAGAAS